MIGQRCVLRCGCNEGLQDAACDTTADPTSFKRVHQHQPCKCSLSTPSIILSTRPPHSPTPIPHARSHPHLPHPHLPHPHLPIPVFPFAPPSTVCPLARLPETWALKLPACSWCLCTRLPRVSAVLPDHVISSHHIHRFSILPRLLLVWCGRFCSLGGTTAAAHCMHGASPSCLHICGSSTTPCVDSSRSGLRNGSGSRRDSRQARNDAEPWITM